MSDTCSDFSDNLHPLPDTKQPAERLFAPIPLLSFLGHEMYKVWTGASTASYIQSYIPKLAHRRLERAIINFGFFILKLEKITLDGKKLKV